MAKKTSHDGTSDGSMMAGGKGMSPRKAIAGAGYDVKGSGHESFGVQNFVDGAINHGGHHPDHVAGVGTGAHLEDHERAIGHPIHHTKHHHPAQAAPHHGPHHPDGHHFHQHQQHPRHRHETESHKERMKE